jgi:hypothetical protein
MFGANSNHFARFRFADPDEAPRVRKTSCQELISRLHDGFAIEGGEIESPFGDEAIALFSTRFERSFWGSKEYEINVGVMPEGGDSDRDWSLHIQLTTPGTREETRRVRAETMKRIDWTLHERLLSLGALDLIWFVQDSRKDPGQPTP